MSENLLGSNNESNPSDEYLVEEISKMKVELDELKVLKDKIFRTVKAAAKRKPAKKSRI